MPNYDWDNTGTTCSGMYDLQTGDTFFGTWKNGDIEWHVETAEQAQERRDKAKQLREDKEKYPLFFWKENIK